MHTPHDLRRVPTAVLVLALLAGVLLLAVLLPTSTSATATSSTAQAANAEASTATTPVELTSNDRAYLADLLGPAAGYSDAEAAALVAEGHVVCALFAELPTADRDGVAASTSTALGLTADEGQKLLDVAAGSYCPGAVPAQPLHAVTG